MADTEKKISELDSAAQVNSDDVTVLSQGNSQSGFASAKATILAIATKIVSGINFTSALQTEDKTITGAINEVAQGGGGSGGHTIKNDAGTSLTQRDNLQFGGVYTHDDSTNNKTKVDIVREFQSVAEIEALTGEAKKGFEVIEDTEEYIPYTGSDILFDNTDTSFEGENVQEVLEEVDGRTKKLFEINSVSCGPTTVPANGWVNQTMQLPVKQGYTPIGIIQMQLNTAKAFITYDLINNGELTVTFATLNATDVTVSTSVFHVLYIRNTIS